MKELYTKPMAEVEEFTPVDILTTSIVIDGSENIDAGWD